MKSRPLRISYWCQFFWPEITAPSRRLMDLGKEWTESGHAVTVVTGMPNHPAGIVPEPYRGKLAMSESQEGLRILRSWVYTSPNRAGIRKLIGHLSFAVTSLLLSGPRLGKTDVVIASSPTFFVVFSAWIIARFKRAKFVFEVRDLWPEVFLDLGALQPGLIFRLLQALVGFLYHRADLVVVVTEPFRDRIAEHRVPWGKIVVVSNGANIEWFGADVDAEAAARRSNLGLDGLFVVAYIGAHGISQGLKSVLRAAELCVRNTDIRFLFVGDGSERLELERYKEERKLPNVLMLREQPAEAVREFYALADVCLVPLRDVALFETFVPSKMFEIMAAARPIIGSVSGEARRILEQSGGARIVAPDVPEALAQSVAELRALPAAARTEMGRRGQAYVAAHYSRHILADRYLKAIAESPG